MLDFLIDGDSGLCPNFSCLFRVRNLLGFSFLKHGAGSRESANNRTTFSIWRIFRVPCVFVLTELENRHQYKH